MKLILRQDSAFVNKYDDGWGIWDLFPHCAYDSTQDIWALVKQEIKDHENQKAASTAQVD